MDVDPAISSMVDPAILAVQEEKVALKEDSVNPENG